MKTIWALFLAVAVALAAAAGPVSWDNFSLSINGTRVFIQSGEFHYQRLPVPELWLDVFQKLKANGFNTVRYINIFLSHNLETRLTRKHLLFLVISLGCSGCV